MRGVARWHARVCQREVWAFNAILPDFLQAKGCRRPAGAIDARDLAGSRVKVDAEAVATDAGRAPRGKVEWWSRHVQCRHILKKNIDI